MGKDSQELGEFNRLIGQRVRELVPVQTVWAVVKAVDWESKTMTATGQVDELDYHEVSLGSGWEYKKPKVGEICLLGVVQNNTATAFLIDAKEIEEIAVNVDGTTFNISPEGIKIERDGENLFTCFKDMITEINKIIVVNGTSINVAAMEVIEQRLNTILIE